MRRFHAHIYFEDHEIFAIKRLRQHAENSPLKIWQLFEHCVGPHSRPMLELQFDETTEVESLEWLRKNHGTFSVLVHIDTGNDFNDHQNPLWLGPVLPLYFDFFDQVKNDPSASVHA